MNIGVNARLLVNNRMEGIPRYIFETTRHMALSHPEDQFFLFFDRKVNGLPTLPQNVRHVVVPWHARHPFLWHIWLEYTLPLFFKKYKIDVFYSGDGYLSLRSKMPTVMAIHDLAYLYFPQHIPLSSVIHYRKFVPKYLKKACHVMTVSQYVKKDLCSQFQIAPEKISVAGNAVDVHSIPSVRPLPDRPGKLIENTPYFLYVGAVHPRKNILHLIEAFTLFSHGRAEKFSLVIAGRLAWKSTEIQKALETTPDIIYLGSVSEEEKYSLIQNAMAVTYVSLFEGFGIPILEAMACGTPVITSSTTSMPEVAGGAALLADPEKPESIAAQMQKIADNPGLRKNLSSEGLQRCHAFSWQTSAETIYQALKRCSS